MNPLDNTEEYINIAHHNAQVIRIIYNKAREMNFCDDALRKLEGFVNRSEEASLDARNNPEKSAEIAEELLDEVDQVLRDEIFIQQEAGNETWGSFELFQSLFNSYLDIYNEAQSAIDHLQYITNTSRGMQELEYESRLNEMIAMLQLEVDELNDQYERYGDIRVADELKSSTDELDRLTEYADEVGTEVDDSLALVESYTARLEEILVEAMDELKQSNYIPEYLKVEVAEMNDRIDDIARILNNLSEETMNVFSQWDMRVFARLQFQLHSAPAV